MVTFVLRMLGEDVLGVELTKQMIWASFETATREFNAKMIEYQNKSNLASILGMPTGSLDENGNNNINISNMYVQQNLEFLNMLAAPYASIVGFGQSEDSYMGYIHLSTGRQEYDLYTDLVDVSGSSLWSQQASGSVGGMQVVEVFHGPPAQYMFNSNLASNFVASGLPVESWIPDTRFYVLPLFEDVLRGSMLKEAQKIRRSHYTYKISGRKIRIYPVPNNLRLGYYDRVWLRVRFSSSPFPSIANSLVNSGSSYQVYGSGSSATTQDDKIYGVNGPFNSPFGPLNYNSLNMWSRNWIAQFTLALCTELLGKVRSKFKNIPIPGADLQLDGDDLRTAGREMQSKLLDSLKETLDGLTYDKLAEQEAAKTEAMVKQLSFTPIPPKYVFCVW